MQFRAKAGVIIDDIIDTGKSVVNAARVLVYCVYDALPGERPARVELCVSNSIPRKQHNIDAAYTISRLIKRAFSERSADELLL